MNFITILNHTALFKTTSCILIITFILTFVLPSYSQVSGEQLLKDGIKLYESGKLKQAITKLSRKKQSDQ